MEHPLVVVCEAGHRLANLLRIQAPGRRWLLRHVTSADACREALPRSAPGVLVVDLDVKRPAALDLLAWVQEHRPSVAPVAALAAASPTLALAAWELGARHVLPPERVPADLAAVVSALIEGVWAEGEA
jgi:DNA-binding NarL/FixJ family response regulator